MVGRTLTHTAMETVLRHMGQIDKPWNCPHGRPTMRHLASLDTWQGWSEGEGLAVDLEGDEDVRVAAGKLNWDSFMARTQKRPAEKAPVDVAVEEDEMEEDVLRNEGVQGDDSANDQDGEDDADDE